MTWMQTHTGLRVDPRSPLDREFDIRDQIRALSNLARYGGHTRFYSVAEHAVRVAERARVYGGDIDTQRWALIHDNSEAYLCDIPRPLMVTSEFRHYRELERNVQAGITDWLGLSLYPPPLVTELDNDITGTEARLLFPHGAHPDFCDGNLPPPWPGVTLLGWDPDTAAARYAHKFEELFLRDGDVWTDYYSPLTRVTTLGLLSSERAGCSAPCCQTQPWATPPLA